MDSRSPQPVDGLTGAVAGVAGAAAALGTAEMLSGVSRRIPSLVVAVGDVVVDHAPFRVVEGAIGLFGTADKTALVVGTVALALVFGGVLGRVAATRPRAAHLGFEAFGVVGWLAAIRVAGASTWWSALAAAVATFAGIGVLEGLLALGRRATRPEAPTASRRTFLLSAAAGVALGGVGGLAGSRLRRRLAVEGARRAVVLPRPVRSDADIAGAALDVDGLSPLVTPNHDFYRIDTAILVPQVDPDDWSLKVTGRVDRPYELTFDELLALPMVEDYVTLSCVSNEVGDDLVGNAKWLGVPLADVIERARPRAGADQVVGRSVDDFTVGFPIEAVRDGRTALVAVGMNGEPLPVRHGFPARLVVSGLYGYVSATKWLSEIELTGWDDFDAYWIPRGWAKEAPVKTQSRIDVPRDGRTVGAGPLNVAGVAWAPHRGISRVEVRVDDGDWVEAELSGDTPADTWRQWRYRWDAEPGNHRIAVRAADGDGEVQTPELAPPAPDGATGHHTISVRAEPSVDA